MILKVRWKVLTFVAATEMKSVSPAKHPKRGIAAEMHVEPISVPCCFASFLRREGHQRSIQSFAARDKPR